MLDNENTYESNYVKIINSIVNFIISYPIFVSIFLLLTGWYYYNKLKDKNQAEYQRKVKTDLSLGQINRLYGNKTAHKAAKIYGLFFIFIGILFAILQVVLLVNKKENIKETYKNLFKNLNMEDFFEKAQKFISEHPSILGIAAIISGIFTIRAAFNPESNMYNVSRQSSKITIASVGYWLGPKAAKAFAIFLGVSIILIGIGVLIYVAFFSTKS